MNLLRFLAVGMRLFAGLLMLNVVPTLVADESVDVTAVLNRIMSRSEQIQTGVFEFSVTTKTFATPVDAPELRVIVANKGSGSELRSLGFLKQPSGSRFPHYQASNLAVTDESNQFWKVSFAGEEWVAHCPAVPSTEIGRGEFAATLTERKAATGEIQRNLLIEPSYKGLTQSSDGLTWRQFLQCGTVPKLLIEFLSTSRHPEESRKLDTGIELVWRLKQSELQQVFGKAVPAYLYQGEFSFLVVRADPSMGYVLPEIHFQSEDRNNQVSFRSTGFKDAGNGVFFPSRWEYSCVSPFNMEEVSFDVLSATGINEPLPHNTFELNLVDGTRVRNTLPGHESVFTIGQASSAKSISECLEYVPKQNHRLISYGTRAMVLIGSIGFGLFLVWMIYKQIFQSRQNPAV